MKKPFTVVEDAFSSKAHYRSNEWSYCLQSRMEQFREEYFLEETKLIRKLAAQLVYRFNVFIILVQILF